MYRDYLDAILRHYEQKQKNNGLSIRLRNPTPSKLRDECVSVYHSETEKKDLKMLVAFFEVQEGSDVLKAIERFDIDKFRPLNNYLKEATERTEDKNIELLAWLLNFEPRPYDDSYDYEGYSIAPVETSPSTKSPDGRGNNKNSSPSRKEEGLIRADPPESGFLRRLWNRADKKIISLFSIGVIVPGVIASIYFSNKAVPFGRILPGKNECMIWTGDQYQQVSCDSPGVTGLPLPLDKSRQQSLLRIKNLDTITEKYIGNIWYRKRGGDSIDLYTAGGRDPVDLNQDLKRMTLYIFKKYVKKTANLK